ncbi:hypothetical protein WA026_004768, partial [Henosepilachna vigintioctopunctata]
MKFKRTEDFSVLKAFLHDALDPVSGGEFLITSSHRILNEMTDVMFKIPPPVDVTCKFGCINNAQHYFHSIKEGIFSLNLLKTAERISIKWGGAATSPAYGYYFCLLQISNLINESKSVQLFLFPEQV